MLGSPLLNADERCAVSTPDRASVAEMLRGRRRDTTRDEEKEEKGEKEEDVEDFAELCERHYDLSAEARANPTELGTAAPHFSTALGLIASRPWRGAMIPLWSLACLGPSFRGPGGLLHPTPSNPIAAWFERVAGCLVLLAVPMHVWIAYLERFWPAAYGSCLRETLSARRRRLADNSPKPSENVVERIEIAATESVDGTEDDAAAETTPAKKPAGSRILECAGLSIGPLAVLGLIGAVVLYVRDASHLECQVTYEDDDQGGGGGQKSNRRIQYPWSCTWASAAWFATRIVDAALLPMLVLLVAAFSAHCLALISTSVAGDEREERVRLVEEANGLWRWPLRVVLSAQVVILALSVGNLFRCDADDATVYSVAAVVNSAFLAVPIILISTVNKALADPPYFVHDVLRPRLLLALICIGGILAATVAVIVTTIPRKSKTIFS